MKIIQALVQNYCYLTINLYIIYEQCGCCYMLNAYKFLKIPCFNAFALSLCTCFVFSSSFATTPKLKPINHINKEIRLSRDYSASNIPKPKPLLQNNQRELFEFGNNAGEALNLLDSSNSNAVPVVDEPAATNEIKLLPSANLKTENKKGILVPDSKGSVEQLRRALNAIENGHYTNAIKIRDALQPSLDRRIIDWRLIVRAREKLPNKFIRDFYREAPHWPSEYIYQTRLEEAMWIDQPAPKLILEVFTNYSPRTEEGKVLLALALKKTNQDRRAKSYVRNLWQTERLEKNLEDFILNNFKSYLTNEDHFHRVDMYLYDEWVNAATRSVRFLFSPQKKYFNARVAVIRKKVMLSHCLKMYPSHCGHILGFYLLKLSIIEEMRIIAKQRK